MYDCLVVGAGPAGSAAAYHLAKQGKSVLVVDQATFPRSKPCGGGVSPAIANWFDCDFTPVIKNTVSRVQYTWKLGDSVTIDLVDVPPMWMVRRDQFDNFLIEQAIALGAEFKPNTEVSAIKLDGETWKVQTSQGEVEASYLIGADGVKGKTAAWLGIKAAKQVPAATLEVSTEVAENLQNLAYFDFGSLKNGFMWAFPKTDGFSFSGAYVRDAKGKVAELEKQLSKFAQSLNLDLGKTNYQEYSMNIWDEDRALHTEKALIAGEASGTVDPLIGEGIRPAIFTGVKAAEAVNKALAGDNAALSNYSETIKQEWGADLAKANNVAGMFYKFPKIAYKVGVKRPSAGQTIGKILCGELRYSDVAEKINSKLKGSFLPGFGK